MTREEVKAKLKELGIDYASNCKTETLEQILLQATTALAEGEVNNYDSDDEKVMHSPAVSESVTIGLTTTDTSIVFKTDGNEVHIGEVGRVFIAATNLKYKKARYKIGDEILVETVDIVPFQEKGYIQ